MGEIWEGPIILLPTEYSGWILLVCWHYEHTNCYFSFCVANTGQLLKPRHLIRFDVRLSPKRSQTVLWCYKDSSCPLFWSITGSSEYCQAVWCCSDHLAKFLDRNRYQKILWASATLIVTLMNFAEANTFK